MSPVSCLKSKDTSPLMNEPDENKPNGSKATQRGRKPKPRPPQANTMLQFVTKKIKSVDPIYDTSADKNDEIVDEFLSESVVFVADDVSCDPNQVTHDLTSSPAHLMTHDLTSSPSHATSEQTEKEETTVSRPSTETVYKSKPRDEDIEITPCKVDPPATPSLSSFLTGGFSSASPSLASFLAGPAVAVQSPSPTTTQMAPIFARSSPAKKTLSRKEPEASCKEDIASKKRRKDPCLPPTAPTSSSVSCTSSREDELSAAVVVVSPGTERSLRPRPQRMAPHTADAIESDDSHVPVRRSSRPSKPVLVFAEEDEDFVDEGADKGCHKKESKPKKNGPPGGVKKPDIFMTKEEKMRREAEKAAELEKQREQESLARYQAERERSRLATKAFFHDAHKDSSAPVSSAHSGFFAARKRSVAAPSNSDEVGGSMSCGDGEKSLDPVAAAKEQHCGVSSVENLLTPTFATRSQRLAVAVESSGNSSSESLWNSGLAIVGDSAVGLRDLALVRTDSRALSLRFEWVKYILCKNRGQSFASESVCVGAVRTKEDLRTSVEVIDLEDSSSDTSSDRGAAGARRISQEDEELESPSLSLKSMHASMSTALIALHRVSMSEEAAGGCTGPAENSILAAETRLTRWLHQWIARYDKPVVAELSSGSTPQKSKNKGRRCRSDYSYDGFEDSEAEADFSDYEQRNRYQRGRATETSGLWGRSAKEELSNVFILSGPRGSLKTSLVHASASRSGYTVIELNAGSDRSGANIRRLVAEASQSKGLKGIVGGGATEGGDEGSGGKMTLILFDEADICFKEDTGFLSTIHQLSKTSKCPLVITTQNLDPSFCAGFHTDPLHVTVQPPGLAQLSRLLWYITERSELKGWMTLQDSESLAIVCNCDIRSCFNTLLSLGVSRSVTSSTEKNYSDFRQWILDRRILGSALDDVQANQAGQWENSDAQASTACINIDDKAFCREILLTTASTLTFLPSRNTASEPPAVCKCKRSKEDEAIRFEDEEGLDDSDSEPNTAQVVTEDEETEAEFDGQQTCKTMPMERSLTTSVIEPDCETIVEDIAFSPIVMSVEPRNVDMWAGGVISIGGKNFMQRRRAGHDQEDEAALGPLAQVTVTVGNTQYHEKVHVYSDSEIGVSINPLLPRPTDSPQSESRKYHCRRAPRQIELVEVVITFYGGMSLSSSVCGSEQAWVCFTDTRAPDEISTPPVVIAERPPLPRQNGKSKRKRFRKKGSVKLQRSSSASSDCDSVQDSVDGNDSEDVIRGGEGLEQTEKSQGVRVDSDDDDFQDDPGFARMVASKRQRVVGDDDDESGSCVPIGKGSRGRQICDEEEGDGDGDGDGDKEFTMGTSPEDTDTGDPTAVVISKEIVPVDVQQVLRRLVHALSHHPLADPFVTPVNPDQFPLYASTVSTPMDIGTIVSSVEENLYNTVEECLQDVQQLWWNCANSDHYSEEVKESARQLQDFVSSLMSEVMADPPLLRREESAKETVAEVTDCIKTLDPPPSPTEMLELLARAERERFTSRGRVVNKFFASDEATATSMPSLFNRQECFRLDLCLPLSTTGKTATQELASLEHLSAYLSASSEADLMRGMLRAHGDEADEFSLCGLGSWVDESSVLPHVATDSSSLSEGAVHDKSDAEAEEGGLTTALSVCDCDLRTTQDMADALCMLGKSIFMNSDLMSDILSVPSRHQEQSVKSGCVDVLIRPRKKQERIQFMRHAFSNVSPSRWPSNGTHSSFSLRGALAMDVVPQLAVMLLAQSPQAMESCALMTQQLEEIGRFRRNTRAAVGRTLHVQRSFTRMAGLLQISDSMLEKLMHVLPFQIS